MELQSSSYYKGKIDEFVALGESLSALSDDITTCGTSVTKGVTYLGAIIICNEPIDKKVLGNNVAKTLDDISDTLKTLVAECNTKIEDYTDLYNDALKQEQRKKKKEGGLFTWI